MREGVRGLGALTILATVMLATAAGQGRNDEGLRRAREGRAAAVLAVEQERRLRERLVSSYPTDPRYQQDLAKTCCDLGNLYQETGQPALARQSFERARSLWQQFARAHPDVPQYRTSLAAVDRSLINLPSAETHAHPGGANSPTPAGSGEVVPSSYEQRSGTSAVPPGGCIPCSNGLCGGCVPCEPCSCPTPAGWVAYADWLNWAVRVDVPVSIRPREVTPTEEEFELGNLSYERANGIRAGLGYRFASGWDVRAHYANFHTNGSFARDWHGLGFREDSVSATVGLNYNVFDLEGGRWLQVCESCEVRLFGGFRWAMMDLGTESYRTAPGRIDLIHALASSDMSAYGLRLGGEGRCTIWNGLSGFARAGGAILVGTFDTQNIDASLPQPSPHVTQGVTVLETAAGLLWQWQMLELAAGYEFACWMNAIPQFPEKPMSDDLLLDGVFVRVGLNY